MILVRWILSLVLLTAGLGLYADGPGDNLPDKVRRIPPPGMAVPDTDRRELQTGIDELGKEIESLHAALKGKPALLELLPDVQIFHNAVRYALGHNEFHKANEIASAKGLLTEGKQRARQLRDGQTPWTIATGPVARGYLSRI